ncbi:MAG: universal stress protein [Acidimicrobiia bacterium]|nr:universal stress protein [Acidimicrobiia bacterium]
MIGPVVCGIDFSAQSRRALAWARLLADRLEQPLVVVHAVEPVLADAARLTYGPDALQASIDPELKTFAGSAAAFHIGVGDPASVINGAALARNASMVVVGTQGHGRAARVWFGSTTMRLLRETTIPVLCVPPTTTDVPEVAALVVGTDFSDASSGALETAVALGSRCGVPVTCLHVVPTVSAYSRWNDLVKGAEDAAVRSARRRMADATAALTAVDAVTTDVRTGDAAEVLLDAARQRGTLIVVGLGGANTDQRPGTTAYRLASGAETPVLGVPPRRT